MKRKVMVGFITMVIALAMLVTPALAAPVAVYDNAGTTTWGKNGGDDGNGLYVKLEDAATAGNFDLAKLSSITTIEVTLDTATYFKPQYVVNTESNNWEAKEVEHADAGHFVDVIDVKGKYLTKNTYNNFVIQSGWKNEGKAQVTAIAFKDADGKVLYSVGDLKAAATDDTAATTDDATVTDDTATTTDDAAVTDDAEDTTDDAAVTDDAEDTTDDAAVTDDAADTTDDAVATDAAAETAVPKTGVVGFGLVYGLGALATGAVALKRKQK